MARDASISQTVGPASLDWMADNIDATFGVLVVR